MAKHSALIFLLVTATLTTAALAGISYLDEDEVLAIEEVEEFDDEAYSDGESGFYYEPEAPAPAPSGSFDDEEEEWRKTQSSSLSDRDARSSLTMYAETFEQGNDGWTISWDNNTIQADADFASTQAAHQGRKGVRITVLNPATASSSVKLTSPQFDLEADEWYTFRFRAVSRPAADVQVVIFAENGTDTLYISRTLRVLSVWRQVAVTFQPEVSAQYSVLISYGKDITGVKPGENAELFFDTFALWGGLFDIVTGEFLDNKQLRQRGMGGDGEEGVEYSEEEEEDKDAESNKRLSGPSQLVFSEGGRLELRPAGVGDEEEDEDDDDGPEYYRVEPDDDEDDDEDDDNDRRSSRAVRPVREEPERKPRRSKDDDDEDDEEESGSSKEHSSSSSSKEKERSSSSSGSKDKDDAKKQQKKEQQPKKKEKQQPKEAEEKKQQPKKEEKEADTIDVEMSSGDDDDSFLSLQELMASEGIARGGDDAVLYSG